MFLVGLLWLLSLINIVFRDLQNFIGIILMFLMIASLSPIRRRCFRTH